MVFNDKSHSLVFMLHPTLHKRPWFKKGVLFHDKNGAQLNFGCFG